MSCLLVKVRVTRSMYERLPLLPVKCVSSYLLQLYFLFHYSLSFYSLRGLTCTVAILVIRQEYEVLSSHHFDSCKLWLHLRHNKRIHPQHQLRLCCLYSKIPISTTDQAIYLSTILRTHRSLGSFDDSNYDYLV